MRPAQLPRNELPHLRQPFFRRRVGGQKLLGQPDRAQGQADGLLNALVF